MEGTRPVLVEIQALVAPSPLGTPRRAVVGWDSQPARHGAGRAGGPLRRAIGANDVYLNVAGGLRISEPAADLAVAAALVSSLAGEPAAARQAWCSARSACAAKSGRSARRSRG